MNLLCNLNERLWIHETRLCELLELTGDDKCQQLPQAWNEAKQNPPSGFAQDDQQHGDNEQFGDSLRRPNWCRLGIGIAVKGKDSLPLGEQKKIIKSIQGTGGRLDDETKKRRQKGWKSWAREEWTDNAANEFNSSDVVLIKQQFPKVFGEMNNREVSKALRKILDLSNIISGLDLDEDGRQGENPVVRSFVV